MNHIKAKIQDINWWEIIYILIFGLIMSYEFYHTTLLNLWLPWPPRTGLVLMGLSAVYASAKLIFYKSYSNKEKIISVIIILAFLLPAVLTQYRFLFWIGFLIVGAKDVEFNKILKLYLVVAVTLMIAAFSASQYGIIEDLQFIAYRENGEYVRHSFGIQYPTDYAAHLFYIVMVTAVLFRDKLKTKGIIWMSLLVTISVFMTANALTTCLCLLGFVMLCVIEKVFRNYMPYIEKIFRWVPVTCSVLYFSVAYFYNDQISWMLKLNQLLTNRLAFGKFAMQMNDIKLFGQDVYEQGHGNGFDVTGPYFFLDNSYFKILLEYGLLAFIVTLLILYFIFKKAANVKNNILIIVLVAISVHSFMEHHLINIAYNPMIFALFMSLEHNDYMNRRNL